MTRTPIPSFLSFAECDWVCLFLLRHIRPYEENWESWVALTTQIEELPALLREEKSFPRLGKLGVRFPLALGVRHVMGRRDHDRQFW